MKSEGRRMKVKSRHPAPPSSFILPPSSFPLQRPLELFPEVGFENVADLDVVVVRELDAPLQARLDLLDVVLDAPQGLDGEVLGDDDAAAGEADLAAALHVAVG